MPLSIITTEQEKESIMLTKALEFAAADLRKVRPTKSDAKRNPDIDVMAVWRSDIEHTIKCKELTPEQADEFRALCNA